MIVYGRLLSHGCRYVRSIGEKECNVSFRDRDVFLPILRQYKLDYVKQKAIHPLSRLEIDTEWITGCHLVQ